MELDAFTLKIIDEVFDAKEKIDAVYMLTKILRENPVTAEIDLSVFFDYFYQRIITLSDWYFFLNFGCDHPEESDFGGIVSYAFYDAGCIHDNDKIYNLKSKDGFKDYISTLQNEPNQ